MDKFLTSTWFVRLISFVVALMLFAVVSVEQEDTSGLVLTGGDDGPQRLEDVPLEAVYDTEQFIIAGLPKNVTVLLEGPEDKINKVKIQNNYRAFVDLRQKEPGKTYTVPVQYEGFPEDLEVQTNPAEVEVTVLEKVTETFPVQIDIRNKDKVAEGYEVGDPIATPNQVKVTGAKQAVEEVAFVKGFVDVEGADETVEENVTLNIYDHEGNELELDIHTPVVEVKVPIIGESKAVPVNLSREASLPDGLSIQSIEIEPSEVTLFGPEEVLKDIDFIEESLNLADITEDTKYELEVPVPDGVNKIDPETVTVTIDVAKQEKKTLENIPIELFGLPDDLSVTFEEPEDQTVDVIVKGSAEVLDKIEAGDIEAYIDVSQLSTGEHTVEIIANGLQNIESELKTKKAQIVVTEKDSSTTESQ